MTIKAALFDLKNKNNKILYYIGAYCRLYFASKLSARKTQLQLDSCKPETKQAIKERVAYYNKLNTTYNTPKKNVITAKETAINEHRKVYFLDTMRYFRRFPSDSKIQLLEGDITYTPNTPSIVKSRPISDNNKESVLLKLNAVRHFKFIKDPIPYLKKEDKAIFRGRNLAPSKDCRRQLLESFHSHATIDVGLANKSPEIPQEWQVKETSILEQLHYKFILCPEGNDVATNLKWVMSSNSIAIMPKPRYETWFMEGKLEANVHYIEVNDDYSNLEEKINYYLDHSEEALAIINNAHQFISQFQDKETETLINHLVLNKYLTHTQQVQQQLALVF